MSISRGLFLPLGAAVAAAAVLAACGGSSNGPASQNALPAGPGYLPQERAIARQALQTPALLSINSHNHALEYWPIEAGGGKVPIEIAKSVAGPGSMAADGNEVAIADGPS